MWQHLHCGTGVASASQIVVCALWSECWGHLQLHVCHGRLRWQWGLRLCGGELRHMLCHSTPRCHRIAIAAIARHAAIALSCGHSTPRCQSFSIRCQHHWSIWIVDCIAFVVSCGRIAFHGQHDTSPMASTTPVPWPARYQGCQRLRLSCWRVKVPWEVLDVSAVTGWQEGPPMVQKRFAHGVAVDGTTMCAAGHAPGVP